MSIRVLGDGCRYCQPQEYIDRLHDQIEEDRADSAPVDGQEASVLGKTLELIEGMTVSVDVSTGDHDAGNRLFCSISGLQEDSDGWTILAVDPEPNFTAPVEQPDQVAGLELVELFAKRAISICGGEASEWDSDDLIMTKNYAEACERRIRRLRDEFRSKYAAQNGKGGWS